MCVSLYSAYCFHDQVPIFVAGSVLAAERRCQLTLKGDRAMIGSEVNSNGAMINIDIDDDS